MLVMVVVVVVIVVVNPSPAEDGAAQPLFEVTYKTREVN